MSLRRTRTRLREEGADLLPQLSTNRLQLVSSANQRIQPSGTSTQIELIKKSTGIEPLIFFL
jgi:hypothetical protein